MKKDKSQERLAPIDEDRRLIEEEIPIKEISLDSIKEKNSRLGNISSFHVWWARKPLIASRIAIYASLVNQHSINESNNLLKELSMFGSHKKTSLIKKALNNINSSRGGKPKILDPFAGGGSIPLEALRLGCTTYALDVNPVANIIELCTLVYPQLYGNPVKGKNGFTNIQNKLANDFKKWGNFVFEESQRTLNTFYQSKKDGMPIAYFWVRTIKCQKPSCNAEIPLFNNFWLQKKGNKHAIKLKIDRNNNSLEFEIVKEDHINFDPKDGIIKTGTALCPFCNSTMSSSEIQYLAKKGKMGERMYSVLNIDSNGSKNYYLSSDEDNINVEKARKKIKDILKNDFLDEKINVPLENNKSFYVHLQPFIFGFRKWSDLFNERQKLSILVFSESINRVYREVYEETKDKEYAKVIVTYLALALNSISHYNTKLSLWLDGPISMFIQGTSISMKWGYCELNPFGNLVGTWKYAISIIEKMIQEFTISRDPVTVIKGDAKKLPFDDLFFDAIITDPPYYDAVPYSDLSDYFYVLLKHSIGKLYPNIFSTYLTPKKAEIIQNISLVRSLDLSKLSTEELVNLNIKSKEVFEEDLTVTLKESNRVLKRNGILTLIFAHKTTEAWESLIKSLLDSNFIVTASWPLHTERNARMRANRFAALASSIFLICRKRLTEEEGYFNEIKDDLKKIIHRKLDEFWKQGIRGADFFISAIGPAVEVFGKYKKVKRLSGEEVTVAELLDEVRKIVTDYSLHQILHDGKLGNIDDMTRFYVLWRWAYKDADVPFDDARKLAQALGTEPDELLSKKGLLEKKGDKVNMFEPWERKDEHLGEPRNGIPAPMIDVIHRACVLWEKNNKKALEEFIESSGYASEEALWNVAQAISDILPDGDKEKQLLQGLLNTKTTIKTDKFKSQTTLSSYKGEEK